MIVHAFNSSPALTRRAKVKAMGLKKWLCLRALAAFPGDWHLGPSIHVVLSNL